MIVNISIAPVTAMSIPPASRLRSVIWGLIAFATLTSITVQLIRVILTHIDGLNTAGLVTSVAFGLLFLLFLESWLLSAWLPYVLNLADSIEGKVSRLYTKQSSGKFGSDTRYFVDVGTQSFWVDRNTFNQLHLEDEVVVWYVTKLPPNKWIDRTVEAFHHERRT